MKNSILIIIKKLYYLSLCLLLILYLFPGSLIGYLLYGDFGRQPYLILNPIGASINHLFFFLYLGILGFMFRNYQKKFINSFSFLFIISIILELFHVIIPNRAFELNDLYANSVGVFLAYLLFKIFKKIKR
tara:strand:+ start:234 stop:626 length:393 start_codon:yes stop_codon:yes gene_type:complete